MQSAKPSKLQWLWQHSCVSLLVVLIFSCIVELVVFNHHFFFGGSPYARSAIELPFTPQLNAKAVVISPQQNVLTLDQQTLQARNLKVKLGSAMTIDTVIEVIVEIKDQRSYPDFRPVAKLYLNPSRLGQDEAIAHFRAFEDQVLGVRINFKGPSYGWAAILNEVTINAPEHLDVSFLRVLLMTMVLGGLYLTLRYRWYLVCYDHSRKLHQVLSYGVVAVSLGLTVFFFEALSPHNTNPWAFDIFGEGLVVYTNSEHQLLLDLPKTQEEFYNSDAYTQLLDAFLKGQLNLDVYVDPRFATMNNPYDFGERAKRNIVVTWDRPYYDGKYYVYFGMAPLLMAHAPIYFLTGKVPAYALTCLWLASLSVLGMLWGIRSMMRALVAHPNMLLFLGGQLAAVGSSLVWYLQVGLSHYNMPYLTCIFWMGILVGALYSLFTPQDLLDKRPDLAGGRHLKPWQRRALLVLAGVSIVLIVMSRPLSLLMALVLSLPAVWWLFKENYSSKLLPFARDALFAVVPVVIGACFVMWYNYVRFDSITEFGQSYQLTVDDNSANKLVFAWPLLRNSLYYYLFEPFTFLQEFPFVRQPVTNYVDTGNFTFLTDRVPLMALPLMWALVALVLPRWFSKLTAMTNDRAQMLKVIFWAWCPCAVFLAYGMAYNAGVSGRYSSDITTPSAYLALGALLLLFQSANTNSSGLSGQGFIQAMTKGEAIERGAYGLMYILALWFLLKTVLIAVLVGMAMDPSSPSSGSKFSDMNPELTIYLLRTFMPLLW